jgi:hypothetical protein
LHRITLLAASIVGCVGKGGWGLVDHGWVGIVKFVTILVELKIKLNHGAKMELSRGLPNPPKRSRHLVFLAQAHRKKHPDAILHPCFRQQAMQTFGRRREKRKG